MEKMNRQKDKIERIEVSIEYPKCMEGICRIESVCLFYEGIMESFDDQEMIDNSDFFFSK